MLYSLFTAAIAASVSVERGFDEQAKVMCPKAKYPVHAMCSMTVQISGASCAEAQQEVRVERPFLPDCHRSASLSSSCAHVHPDLLPLVEGCSSREHEQWMAGPSQWRKVFAVHEHFNIGHRTTPDRLKRPEPAVCRSLGHYLQSHCRTSGYVCSDGMFRLAGRLTIWCG